MTEMEHCPFCGCGMVEMDEYERFKCLGCGVLVKFPDSPRQRENAYHGLVINNYDRVWHVEHWNTRALPIPDTPEMVRALDDAYEAGRMSAKKTCKIASGFVDSREKWYECTECGLTAYALKGDSTFFDYGHCPNCGAKVVE